MVHLGIGKMRYRCIIKVKVECFDCGHGIQSEKLKEFIRSVNETLTKRKLEQDCER